MKFPVYVTIPSLPSCSALTTERSVDATSCSHLSPPSPPISHGYRQVTEQNSVRTEATLVGGSISKESVNNAGDCLQCRGPGCIPGSGRSPGEGNGNPLQYSCLENSMDGGVWRVTVHGIARVGHN